MAAFCRKPGLITYPKTIFFSTLSSSPSPSPSSFSSFRAVKSAIQSESDPVKLAEIFQSSANFGRFCRHRPLFHLSIRKLARSHRFDLIERILDHQLKTNFKHNCSEGFWIRIIMLYSSAGMVDQSVRTFDQMDRFNCPQTEKSLCAVLSVHLDNQMYDKIHEIFESVPPKNGISPGIKSYNLVLKAFCEEKRVQSARELLSKIENEAKVVPNIDSYNILLGAYSKVGNKVEFDGIVKEILKKGLEPNLTTYNHRILTLCKNKECVRAKKLLDEMVLKGVKPNSATYDSLIFGFCKVGDLESARKVLERMVGDRYVSPPSSAYYTLLRHMVEEGEFDSALDMCKEIIKRKWVPPFEAMQGLVTGLVERSKVEEAKEVVEKMKNRLRGTAVDSWGEIEAALPFLEVFSSITS
ncbi:hypothetical protein F0562_032322 [Nyssa sinensis]|uniref:Pentacotripeptide-repeat region of PRORP domain-containing protein n=1 Tax=Nyssa sinensis TaxID=561372 RepID=A0A5J5APW2_9ASTE|nr:hypothetical protein F0562_032322 [Nyssa sinensis]